MGKAGLHLAFTDALLQWSSWLPFLIGKETNFTLPAFPAALTENAGSKSSPVVHHVMSGESEVI